jgi:hypothetical protein
MDSQLSWEDLLLASVKHQTYLDKLNRTDDVQRAYDRHKEQLNDGVGQYIKDTVFVKNNRYADYVIQRNPFSYNVAPGITHSVIWINPETSEFTSSIKSRVVRLIERAGEEDCVIFKREKQYQSVPEVEHFHLFTRNKE